jgi:hypothetical protein
MRQKMTASMTTLMVTEATVDALSVEGSSS